MAERVVITGASGVIGSVLRESLRRDYDVVAVDRKPDRSCGVTRLEQTKARAVRKRLEGADLVVDLAADPSVRASWQVVLGNNIPAALNVLAAAAETSVRRVVLASSNHVTGMYERREPYASVLSGRYDGLDPATLPKITTGDPVAPDSAYGIGKAAVEAAGRYYSDEYDLSVICLRIGTVNRADRPRNPRHLSTLLTHRDLVQLVHRALTAPPTLRFGIFYGVSANTWRIWDIDEPRAAIGFAPDDDAERWREPS